MLGESYTVWSLLLLSAFYFLWVQYSPCDTKRKPIILNLSNWLIVYGLWKGEHFSFNIVVLFTKGFRIQSIQKDLYVSNMTYPYVSFIFNNHHYILP
jgi:hypothetical protein